MNKIILIIILLAKNPLIMIILLGLKTLRQILKLLNLKLVLESGLQSTTMLLRKIKPNIGQN